MERTGCVIAGGGPAGLFLGLLLARAGVQVTVLEKHADFLRDFRGDTVHPSTLTLLDELGLWGEVEKLPWHPMRRMRMVFDSGEATVADFSRLRAPYPFVAMVPQWHLLNTIAEAAEREPTFRLVRNAEVLSPLMKDGRVAGVRWTDRTAGLQDDRKLWADLVVGCDGRDSVLRSGLPLREFDVPVDSWWMRLPHLPHDQDAGGTIRRSGKRLLVMLDRGDFYQMNYLIPRGADSTLRQGPVSTLHDQLTELHPWLADRVGDIVSWDDVKLLHVRLNRLRRWSRPGLLCIGDAAHAMSPIGGIGINLAVQDAVAAARYLAGPLLAGRPRAIDRAARRVQRRRQWPTAVTQGLQRFMHNQDESSEHSELPPPMRLLGRHPWLQRGPARLLGIGVRPERAPAWARRTEPLSPRLPA
ncbi:FAD-dependent oxidoreductase [Lentzea sp. NBRC 102530]|uniref:FAD-dependent oxidoreductase n=1 Tax=Lentzea sp. NBRC 102530 TaxID=3032201 RepID=UPI0024A56651|nr:FAD-dependent oxidoreductase [Lentzea sp. NBRC 102530]GLY46795.1 putative monooxygenase, FAD-binding protein [Lentzea sp. NBRC 102530]